MLFVLAGFFRTEFLILEQNYEPIFDPGLKASSSRRPAAGLTERRHTSFGASSAWVGKAFGA
jgi:hypothetical protein